MQYVGVVNFSWNNNKSKKTADPIQSENKRKEADNYDGWLLIKVLIRISRHCQCVWGGLISSAPPVTLTYMADKLKINV